MAGIKASEVTNLKALYKEKFVKTVTKTNDEIEVLKDKLGKIDASFQCDYKHSDTSVYKLVVKYYTYLGYGVEYRPGGYEGNLRLSSLKRTIWRYAPFKWWANWRVKRIERWAGI